jgi:hypothetical protein
MSPEITQMFAFMQTEIDKLKAQLAQFQSAAELDPIIQKTVIEVVKEQLKLSDLSDVSGTDSASTGDVLKKTSTTWQPGSDNT